MRKSGNWYWPEFDQEAEPAILSQAKRLPLYLRHINRFGVCVQAGGNVGVFPELLSRHFSVIHTFEPDLRNWECLVSNMTGKNIIRTNAGLSSEKGVCRIRVLEGEEANCGALMINPGEGKIPLIAIDDLGLETLDYLMLDIEGAEYSALLGAKQSIQKFKPVIALELKGLGQHFGHTDEMCIDFLVDRGYRQVDEIGRDKVFSC